MLAQSILSVVPINFIGRNLQNLAECSRRQPKAFSLLCPWLPCPRAGTMLVFDGNRWECPGLCKWHVTCTRCLCPALSSLAMNILRILRVFPELFQSNSDKQLELIMSSFIFVWAWPRAQAEILRENPEQVKYSKKVLINPKIIWHSQ